jgi:hypothetical protein
MLQDRLVNLISLKFMVLQDQVVTSLKPKLLDLLKGQKNNLGL